MPWPHLSRSSELFAEEVAQSQYNEICEWQRRIFTKATPLSCANHLKEEVDELITDLTNQETGLSEIADCFLLLIGVCNMKGLSHSDVVQLIETKMKINRERQWGEVNEKGYVKHIETHPSDGSNIHPNLSNVTPEELKDIVSDDKQGKENP